MEGLASLQWVDQGVEPDTRSTIKDCLGQETIRVEMHK